jgi:hypothetical protein
LGEGDDIPRSEPAFLAAESASRLGGTGGHEDECGETDDESQ